MFYKDEEILARVHYTGQKLLPLKEDGEVDIEEEPLFEMEHDDESVVWYEVAGCEHIRTPFDNPSTGFYDDIEDAKKAIDWMEKDFEKNYQGT